jgi:hypothetical protein
MEKYNMLSYMETKSFQQVRMDSSDFGTIYKSIKVNLMNILIFMLNQRNKFTLHRELADQLILTGLIYLNNFG